MSGASGAGAAPKPLLRFLDFCLFLFKNLRIGARLASGASVNLARHSGREASNQLFFVF